MKEETKSIFTDICAKITTCSKEDLKSYVNQIWYTLNECSLDDYFEKLSLLGLGAQLAHLTGHYRKEWFNKELCSLIASEGKNHFKEEMNLWLDIVETGLKNGEDNIAFLDDIDFTSTFLTVFVCGNYKNYKQIIFNLRSIANGKFNPSKEHLSISFAIYFVILGYYFDFPDNDAKTLINLLNYYILSSEKDRLDRFNIELERFFTNFIKIDFSERRYFYTDLPFIYAKIAERKQKTDDEITIAGRNMPPVKTKIKSEILSELQTVSRSLEIILSLENIFNPSKQNEMRLVLFERVFFNKRRIRQENPKEESKVFLMKQTPFGMYKIPENIKLHHESAISLFKEAISVFKSLGKENQLEAGKALFGMENIYQGTLNLEHGVALCLYMLLKEMSFDDVKEIFSDSEDSDSLGVMKKLLAQNEAPADIKLDEKSETDKAALLEQMLFFMFWEICGYENSESKEKEHQFETWLKNLNLINDSGLDFTSCFHPFMDFQRPEINQAIQEAMLSDSIKGMPKRPSFRQYVEYRNPFWWKIQLPMILSWNAFKCHLNSSNGKDIFDKDFNISELKDRSLLVELLFRFSRTEPEFKENIIAMLNHLRELQKNCFPVYFDSKEKSYNQDALKNQEKVRNIDRGFWISAIYQRLYPFNTEEFIKKYGEEKYFYRPIIECRLFQESCDVLKLLDEKRILKDYRETNKAAMYTRYLYLDRNNYVHNGSSRTIKELLKPEKCRDLLLTLADFLLYLDSDSERYAEDKTKKAIAGSEPFLSSNAVCTESIRNECKTLAFLMMKILGCESDEISIIGIEKFAESLKSSFRFDYNCELSENEFLRERLERLLNIIFLTYEPDFKSQPIDFLTEHKMQILLYIASVTFRLVKEVE